MAEFEYQETPENSPYIVPSPTDPAKTRLSLEGFRFWCFMPGEKHHEFGLTEAELDIWHSDPVLSGSNRGQEWGDGPSYLYVTLRKILKEELGSKEVTEEVMDSLEGYGHSDMPIEYPTYVEAEDFLMEYFVYADLPIRTLVYETFRDNFDALLAEAEIERATEPSETSLEAAGIIEAKVDLEAMYRNAGLEPPK